MNWNDLWKWVQKKAQLLFNYVRPEPAQDDAALAEANAQIQELSIRLLVLEEELAQSRVMVSQLTEELSQSQSAAAKSAQETERLSTRANELDALVERLENQRTEEMEALFEFRRVVIEYLVARHPLFSRVKVTGHFNQFLAESLSLTDDELKDRRQEKDPKDVYDRFLAYIGQHLQSSSTDPAT